MISVFPSVVISGIGLVSPLGQTAQQTWEALLAGQFICDHGRVAGVIAPGRTHIAQLSITAASEASSHWTTSQFHDAALVVGTSKGPIDDWLNAPSTLSDLENGFGIAALAGELGRKLGIGKSILTTCAACASGLYALIRGVMLIENDEADRVLIVAAESALHPLFLSSFEKLGVLAPIETGCRPFDVSRAGFLVSEAAAAVCLERAIDHEVRPRISQFAMTADASHLTRSSEANESLKRAIKTVVAGEQIDLIHAHGTGTIHNDPTELAAIENSIQAHRIPPSVYSHKGALGHTSGAAGLISVVINVLAHRHGIVPPNARLEQPIPSRGLRIDSRKIERTVRKSIAIAAGFGGHIAAVSLAS